MCFVLNGRCESQKDKMTCCYQVAALQPGDIRRLGSAVHSPLVWDEQAVTGLHCDVVIFHVSQSWVLNHVHSANSANVD